MWKPYANRQIVSSEAETEAAAERPADNGRERVNVGYVAVLLAAISYNALLAIVNAHAMSLTVVHVALCEFAILAAAAVMIARSPVREEDGPALALGALFLVGTVILSWINGTIYIAPLRNIVIIVLFTMVGIRCNRATLRAAFLASLALVSAVMAFELAALSSYSALFAPFRYYQNTRGLGEMDPDDIGLFGNTLGFEGRFTFGLFSTPRTASLFLEQTSLANFATICVIYLVSLWRSAWRIERWWGIGFVAMALLSNNTRTASALAAVLFFGYPLFTKMPRYATALLPLLMLLLAWGLTATMGTSKEDDLSGRIGLTIHMLSMVDVPALLGQRALQAELFPDSGYSYVLYSCSLFGALALWFFVALVVPFRTEDQRRCAWAISIFFFVNLLIGGNALFTIKIAAFLWMLAGYMRAAGGAAAAVPADRRGQPFSHRLAVRTAGISIQR